MAQRAGDEDISILIHSEVARSSQVAHHSELQLTLGGIQKGFSSCAFKIDWLSMPSHSAPYLEVRVIGINVDDGGSIDRFILLNTSGVGVL